MQIREYTQKDLAAILTIWNEVIEAGDAFAEEEGLNPEDGSRFFSAQSYTAVAEIDGKIVGAYILHPNFTGRLGHICNASYAVSAEMRGRQIGEHLVKDSMRKARELGFQILQFNAVRENNLSARHLYERLGFVQIGTIPNAFRMRDGHCENVCSYYHLL